MTFVCAHEPTYIFLVRLWSGLLFMVGCVSWEAGRNVAAGATLLKYIWIENAIVAFTVPVGHLGGEVPPRLMCLAMLTNLPWIPVILSTDLALRRESRSDPGPTSHNKGATHGLPSRTIPCPLLSLVRPRVVSRLLGASYEYATGQFGLYDVVRDPYELSGQYLAGNTALQQQLSARVAALKACHGAACR